MIFLLLLSYFNQDKRVFLILQSRRSEYDYHMARWSVCRLVGLFIIHFRYMAYNMINNAV